MSSNKPSDDQLLSNLSIYINNLDRMVDKLEETRSITTKLTVDISRIEKNILELSSTIKRLEVHLIETREELSNKLAKMEIIVEGQKEAIDKLHKEIYGNGKYGLKAQVAAVFAVGSAAAVILSFLMNLSFMLFSGK